MATLYVWDSSSQDDSDATWNSSTLAYLTIELAESSASDGDTIYVASDHSESGGAITLDSSFSIGDKPRFISVNRSTMAFETMVTGGGIISCTDANVDIYLKNNAYYNGVYFSSSDDFFAANGAGVHSILENCTITFNDNFGVGLNHNERVDLINCDVTSVTLSQFNVNKCTTRMTGGSYTTTASPTVFLDNVDLEGGEAVFTDVDLSGVYANASIIDANVARCNIVFTRCKMWTGWNVPTLTTPNSGTIKLHSCDTGDGYWHFYEASFYGAISQNTAYYLNATYDGSNGFSAKMVSNSNAEEYSEPLRYKLCEVYADANPTITVELACASTLSNDDFWVEIESNDATDNALGGVSSTKPATITTTPTALDTSAEVWSTTDLTEQKVSKTISGGAAGIVTVWACLAKPSTTVYVDPDVTVS